MYWSSKAFNELVNRINKEIKRRSTYKWWKPLTKPTVGQDQSSPNAIDENFIVDERTYTINTPSTGSIESTRNQYYEQQKNNPGGNFNNDPDASNARFDLDELKNLIVGLCNIHDINLFYGRDEIDGLGFRNLDDLLRVLSNSELDKLCHYVTYDERIKDDPNGGLVNIKNKNYPQYTPYEYTHDINEYCMKSGEKNGEEANPDGNLDETNFFDDYGAKPGDGSYHSYSRGITPYVERTWYDDLKNRNKQVTRKYEGGIRRKYFGMSPRNPNEGREYRPRPAFQGSNNRTCQIACTGLCSVTCDNVCSESCTTTCTERCGNACTSTCGNICTGCTTLCFSSCVTNCKDGGGHACLNNGVKTVNITTNDNLNPSNKITVEYHSCNGCSYSCQFYPNKKTECWDSACMGRCYETCNISCSESCFGGCIGNVEEVGNDYKTGKGRGCSSGCTVNCVGQCELTCEGLCMRTCFHACQDQCNDNCSWQCETNCGNGCYSTCINSSTKSNIPPILNNGVSCNETCISACKNDCNNNCVGFGCRSICGIENTHACDANCRLNCIGTSCTSKCYDQCSSYCTSCINTCNMKCGACTTQCSVGCGSVCNITCVDDCESDCQFNCTQSCTNTCNSCTDLCYSCTGMCIGQCSVHCTSTCSNCANQCSWWCDIQCNRKCLSNCESYCLNSCEGSCIGHLQSETNTELKGVGEPPTSKDYFYQHIHNRYEERESLKIFRPIDPYKENFDQIFKNYKVAIYINENGDNIDSFDIIDINLYRYKYNKEERFKDYEYIDYGEKIEIRHSSIHAGIFSLSDDGTYKVNKNMLPEIIESTEANFDNEDDIILITIFEKDLKTTDIWTDLPYGFTDIKVQGEDEVHIIIKLDPFYIRGKTNHD